MNKIKLASFIILTIVVLNSCALRPIATNYDFQKNITENIGLEQLGNGQVLIYNGAGFLTRIDNTARLNMWIDEKPMGQIRAGEYAIIKLENGTYTFRLLHLDLFAFKSKNNVTIDDTTKVIRIKPTVISNKITITNKLPSNFEKFSYVKGRNKNKQKNRIRSDQ